MCEDNDPLDVLVLMQCQVAPFSFLHVKPIGVMGMLDQGERDDKVGGRMTGYITPRQNSRPGLWLPRGCRDVGCLGYCGCLGCCT